jgi:hypothetical protein
MFRSKSREIVQLCENSYGVVHNSDSKENDTADCGSFCPMQLGFGVNIRRVFAVRFDVVHHSYSLPQWRVLCSAHPVKLNSGRNLIMEWTTPQHEEINLNCEISSYTNAEL